MLGAAGGNPWTSSGINLFARYLLDHCCLRCPCGRFLVSKTKIPKVHRREETLVISHTSCRAAGSGDRWKWSLAVGDAADGARCGYVESMTVSFPGTKLSQALVERCEEARPARACWFSCAAESVVVGNYPSSCGATRRNSSFRAA